MLLFNGFCMTLLAFLTILGVTNETLAKWQRARRGARLHRHARQSGDRRRVRPEDPGARRGRDRGRASCSDDGEVSAGARRAWRSSGRRMRDGRRRPSPWWAGWRLSVVLLTMVIVGGTLGYMVIEGWGLWDALLHDGHLGDDGRVPRGAPALARRASCSPSVVADRSASRRSSTRSRSSWRGWSRETCRSAGRAAAVNACSTISTTISSSAASAASGRSSPQEFARQCGAVRRHRARPRSDAGGDRRRLSSRSRPTRAASRCSSGSASSGRAASSPRSAPMQRTSTPS